MELKTRFVAFVAVGVALGASAFLPGNEAEAGSQCGQASWYGGGGRTASGERMSGGVLAAAHRSLPFGTRVKVENLGNGKAVVVRINDRGPFVRGRVIDVTRAAAQQLGFVGAGVARIRMTVVGGKGNLSGNCS